MSILELAIGWLAPAECIGCGAEGSALCDVCSLAEVVPYGERCFICNKFSPDWVTCDTCRRGGSPRRVWITTDYEGAAKQLVRLLKFRHLRTAAKPLAYLMSATLSEGGSVEEDYLVIAVPTATSRVRQRSFDHTSLLSKEIASLKGLEHSKELKRLGQSRQVGAKRSDRLAQAHDNYYVSRPERIKGRNILLIDDVITTGATLRAATRALKRAGAKQVDALVFAKRL